MRPDKNQAELFHLTKLACFVTWLRAWLGFLFAAAEIRFIGKERRRLEKNCAVTKRRLPHGFSSVARAPVVKMGTDGSPSLQLSR